MSTSNALNRKLIYVVDDEEFMSDMVREILLLEDYDAVSFQDPLEALRSMESANPKPDLLLTDYVMDSLNGMDLIKRCKEFKPSLKTILFSGNVNEEIMRKYDFKPDFFLNKPFLPRDLLQKIGQCLNSPKGT